MKVMWKVIGRFVDNEIKYVKYCVNDKFFRFLIWVVLRKILIYEKCLKD